jgi:hypothetical protein
VTPPTRKPALTRAPVRDHPVAPSVEQTAAPAAPATAMLSARVDADLRQAVKRHAVEHGTSVQQIVSDAVRAYLAQQGAP